MQLFHPAVNAVRGEVNRINDIVMQMVSSDSDALSILRGKLVDALKVTCYENIPDSEVKEAKASRRLVDMTLRYINRVLKSNDPSLVYSIKLSRLNIV
jgi:hypothetical protein